MASTTRRTAAQRREEYLANRVKPALWQILMHADSKTFFNVAESIFETKAGVRASISAIKTDKANSLGFEMVTRGWDGWEPAGVQYRNTLSTRNVEYIYAKL